MAKHKDAVQMRVMIDGAHRYAEANKSDPFALARALTHIRVGIAEYAVGKEGGPGYYDATEDRNEYGQKIWRNVGRV